jgi:hypothetical protein
MPGAQPKRSSSGSPTAARFPSPLEWFPRLRDATAEQRKRWRLIGGGVGLHWDDLDEDISDCFRKR